MYEIRLEGVNFSYGRQLVLKDITFIAAPGSFVCLLGPTGSGKSSLLRLISGLSQPSTGKITINGREVTGPGLDRGLVFQDYSLFPWMSTGDNILLALEQAYPKEPVRKLKAIAHDYLKLVGLPNEYNKLPGQLSGGMRQRAAIARAYAIDPPILLMDEPFGALDAVTRARLQDLLLQLWQQREEQKKTVIFVTHDVEEALLMASEVVVLGLNPGVVKEVCPVDLQRPRIRRQLYNNQTFISLRNHLVGLLHQDVLSELSVDQTAYPPGDKI